VAVRRDRVEARYAAWQARSERFAALRKRLAGYKGKLLPYLVGGLDVAGVATLMHQFGVTVNDVAALLQR
jgi:hypothetical protein